MSSSARDLETLRQELMADMRQELQKVKDEIVQGLLRKRCYFYSLSCSGRTDIWAMLMGEDFG